MECVRGCRQRLRRVRVLWAYRSTLVVLLTPLILLPLPALYPVKAGRCAYGILVMAVYWMTEAIPMAATALLPVVIMPWLGVAAAKELSVNYLKDTNMLFFGGLLVAVAVERWNLHKRIALRVLLLVGSKPKWLMFGFMATTAFLSMWISNTATTAMMIPIAHAVLTELGQHRPHKTPATADDTEHDDEAAVEFVGGGEKKRSVPMVRVYPDDNCPTTPPPVSNDVHAVDTTKAAQCEDPAFVDMCKGITLCVAYAANIGGTATLTGTGPNLVLKGQIDTLYGSEGGINFSSWFIFAFPNMLLCLLAAWLWLQLLFLGPRELFSCCLKRKQVVDDTANEVIRREYRKLGPISWAEASVLVHFIVLALLWLSREPAFMPGWSTLPILEPGFVTDAAVAITVAISLFMFPATRPNLLCFRRKGDVSEPCPAPSLLDWPTVHSKMPWSVVLVLGGGFALADACKISGLSAVIGDAFVGFRDFPTWGLVFILCTVTAVFTEITSNVATATIFLPILAQLATSIGVHPLYLMIPVTIATSFAFMLPVATPPNAIVFAYGSMKIIDMVKAGVVMNIVCVIILQLAINGWGVAYFNLHDPAPWLLTNVTNATATPLANNVTVMLLSNTTLV